MAGLTSTGLEIKRLSEIISDRQTSARNYFGAEAAVGVDDVLGRALRIHSDSERDLWELAEAVHNAFNPNYATGDQLDSIVAYANLTRFDAENATASLLLTGDLNTVIPAGSTVSSSSTSEQYETDSQTTLNKTGVSGFRVNVLSAVDSQTYTITLGGDSASYTASSGDTEADIAADLSSQIGALQGYTSSVVETSQVDVVFEDVFVTKNVTVNNGLVVNKVSKIASSTSVENTDTEQPTNTIDTISSPVSGWDSVTNPEASTVGRDKETDEELRVRFANAKEANAKGTIDAIYANLILLSGVEGVQVYENETNAVDANGLPAHSFSTVILGGNSQEIADTIWDVKPAGITTYGNTSVDTTDSQGIVHTINFSRPVEVDVYISITISQAEGESLPSSAPDQIKDALSTYFDSNLSVGNDVIYSRLFIPIQSVTGVQVDELTIGTSASPTGTSNIVIDFDEIANLDTANVIITVA